MGGCCLWGFDGAAVWVGDALAGIVVRRSDNRSGRIVVAAAVDRAILA
jgi:hypothetical protein